MGFGRGGRGGGDRSSSRGGSFRGGRSFGNKSNSSSSYQEATPDNVVPLGYFVHSCEGEMVCKSTHQMIPYFNAPIYLENKTQIGKIDEILGPINEVYFTVKTVEGVVASSFRAKDQVYVSGEKLLPLERFMPKPKAAKVGGGKKRGAGGPRTGAPAFGRGAFAGRARGGGRGGFGGSGASRGGISKFNRGGASRGGSSFRGSGGGARR